MSVTAKNIVWIVSYPKSGNTWVRLLVCNLVFGPQQSGTALNALVPDLHELGPAVGPPASPVFLKTHFPFSTALPLAPYTAGAIYVVRDPADVMLSNFYYSRRSGAVTASDSMELDQYVDQYLTSRGDPRWIKLHMGTWDQHVRTWLVAKHPFPVLLIRYEDLLADCAQAARRICSFLTIARSASEIDRAVTGVSFQRMREIEESDIRAHNVGIFYKPYLRQSIDAGLRFMRAGKSGEAGLLLSASQRQRVATAFGSVMQGLGYRSELPTAREPDACIPSA
jgi:hypothetical protein